jgi:hypothetical protein
MLGILGYEGFRETFPKFHTIKNTTKTKFAKFEVTFNLMI